MRYKISWTVCVVLTGLLAYALVSAQNPATPATAPGDEQAIRKATAAFVAAYNKGSVDGILALWADKCEYVDEDGKSTTGRADLTAMYKKALAENKGAKVKITTSAIRFVKDDVALDDGESVFTMADGTTDTTPFTAVWVKKADQWLLHRVRELPSPAAAVESPRSQLKDLRWLVGDWTSANKEKDTKTAIAARWMKGQKFLALDYSVQRKGAEVLALTQIIGWDPTTNQVHSWVFDSNGGFGEGAWQRQGKAWIVQVSGVTASGSNGTGTMRWTKTGDDSFTFEALDRTLDGEAMPDVKVTYSRKKAK